MWSDLAPGHAPRGVAETYLDACPPLLQSPEIEDFDAVIPIRAVSLPETVDDDPPPWLAGLLRPAAYLTLGTVPVFSTPDRLRACVDALAPLVSALVVTTGPNAVETLGELPANVHAVRYVTQSQVLPHVDLVVSHGGAGTTLGAIESGLPHLLLPYESQSQVGSAAAIDRLGAGLVLASDERDPTSIGAAARRLLEDPSTPGSERRHPGVAGGVARPGVRRTTLGGARRDAGAWRAELDSRRPARRPSPERYVAATCQPARTPRRGGSAG